VDKFRVRLVIPARYAVGWDIPKVVFSIVRADFLKLKIQSLIAQYNVGYIKLLALRFIRHLLASANNFSIN